MNYLKKDALLDKKEALILWCVSIIYIHIIINTTNVSNSKLN